MNALKYDTSAACSLMVVIIVLFVMISITNTAQAYPCRGHSAREYCIGYHDGAIQAHRDYNSGNDWDHEQHRCTHDTNEYCNGYIRGYIDEEDFLG
jgi:hypothetical protein